MRAALDDAADVSKAIARYARAFSSDSLSSSARTTVLCVSECTLYHLAAMRCQRKVEVY